MCNYLGVDGVTVSILTPLPKTPLYYQLKEEGRLLLIQKNGIMEKENT